MIRKHYEKHLMRKSEIIGKQSKYGLFVIDESFLFTELVLNYVSIHTNHSLMHFFI